MTVERAVEIIAAYGGDPARWPAAERAATLALVEADAGLERARRDASALDVDLSSWSQEWSGAKLSPSGAAVAARVLAARPASRPARPIWRWVVGTGMAAAVAAGVMSTNPLVAPVHTRASQGAAYHGPASDAAAFAMVFTPTPDEDSSI